MSPSWTDKSLTSLSCDSGVLWGINRGFPRLSLCPRQVAHVLLTRPPLFQVSSFRRLSPLFTARLACVRHVANVHPEPGSNSQFSFSWLFLILVWFVSLKVINIILLFRCVSLPPLEEWTFIIIAVGSIFVNGFFLFLFFRFLFLSTDSFLTIPAFPPLCQVLSLFFSFFSLWNVFSFPVLILQFLSLRIKSVILKKMENTVQHRRIFTS